MFELFTEECSIQYPVVKWPEMDYIQRSYTRELLNIEDYYHNRVYAVKSNHFLSSILYHLTAPLDYSNDRYVEAIRTRAPYVANALQITSELNPGKLHDGLFYGPGCPEIIISDDAYFDTYAASLNWKSISAVTPLMHPRSDMKFMFPNGKPASSEKGLAVISINLPLLAFQYRCFTLQQSQKEDNSTLGIAHFIHMYVLPNMLYANTDLAVINRMMNLYYGAPMGEVYYKHAFNIINYTGRLDKILEKEINHLANTSTPYAAMLENIPVIVASNAGQALQLPELPPTRQVWWSLVLSRLPMMKFLIDLGGDRAISRNRAEIGKLQRVLKRLQNEHVFETRLPTDMLHDTLDTIAFIEAI